MAIRLKKIEEFLTGYDVNRETIEEAANLVEESIFPISDIRASADYRKKVSRGLFIKIMYESLKKYGCRQLENSEFSD
jgi:xanthine dehydrogenase iron-sulfur cluster and FAD-binding subunit A